jgi:hypothetical protein
MLPPRMPVDRARGAIFRFCSSVACAHRTVALNRAEARALAELLTSDGFSSNLALLHEALLVALEERPP